MTKKMTQVQKEKKLEEEIQKIDILTIVLIIVVLVICAVVGISIGKMLFDLAMANA